MGDFFQGVGYALGAVIMWIAIFALLMAPIYWVNSEQCTARYSGYGETKYGFIEKCMVHYKGRWVPSTVFREVE